MEEVHLGELRLDRQDVFQGRPADGRLAELRGGEHDHRRPARGDRLGDAHLIERGVGMVGGGDLLQGGIVDGDAVGLRGGFADRDGLGGLLHLDRKVGQRRARLGLHRDHPDPGHVELEGGPVQAAHVGDGPDETGRDRLPLELTALEPDIDGHRDVGLGQPGAIRVGHRHQEALGADGQIARGGKSKGVGRESPGVSDARRRGGTVVATCSEDEQGGHDGNQTAHGERG